MADHPKNRLSVAAQNSLLKYCKRYIYPVQDSIHNSGRLLFIINGLIEIRRHGSQRHDMIIECLDSGHFYAAPGDPDDLYLSVRTNSLIGEIEQEKFDQLLAGELKPHAAEILAVIAAQLAERLHRSQRNYINALKMDVTGRIAQLLIDLAQHQSISHPDGRQIRITRQELGELVGCSREWAGKTIRQLAAQKLISAHGKTIVIYSDQ